ncbi:MAG TPA: 5-(carboxyamino)imidazole ribonucleotide mutase [Candidatus Acidoferrales bacterium]|nr:5-(carboxyamino)imidazole ribonucleotide mutase [Candidatus Acidoferrales bacterium]
MSAPAALRVAILMGSDSDLPVMSEAAGQLAEFGVGCEIEVLSAHRSPQRLRDYVEAAPRRGIVVFIVGAGGAAHLGGVVASLTTLPVIAVPLAATSLGGLDALLATVQMPAGVPVATMALDKAGARNAAVFAAQMLALGNEELAARLKIHKQGLARSVEEQNARAKQKLPGGSS